jgi:hypothetical protein
MVLIRKSFNSFFSTIWHFFSVLLSDRMINIPQSIHQRILIGVWLLMAGNVLLSAFSGCLRGFMIRKVPIKRIDSWMDLYENFKDVRIQCTRFLPLFDFAENDESDMARDFYKRLDIIETVDILKTEKQEEMVENVFKGKHVFVHEYFVLHYYKNTMNRMKEIQNKYNEGLDYHVSKEGAGIAPYFISVLNNGNAFIIHTLNKV